MKRIFRIRPILFFLIFLALAVSPAHSESSSSSSPAVGKQEWINATFKEGKKAYDEGRYDDALRAWAQLDPYFDRNPAIKKVVQYFVEQIKRNRGYTDSQLKQQTGENTATAPPSSVTTPSTADTSKEMTTVLSEANQRIQNENQQVQSQISEAQSSQGQNDQKQEEINASFEKGKAFYYQGKYDEAIIEWQKIVPYVPADSAVIRLIDALKQNYQTLKESQKSAGTVQTSAPVNPPHPPDDFSNLLNEMNEKLKQEAESAKAQAAELQSRQGKNKEEQDFIDKSFEKGKLLYYQGNYEGAITEWNKIVPHLWGSHKDISETIQRIKENFQAAQDAKNAASESASDKKRTSLEVSKEFSSMLIEADQRMEKEAEDTRAQLTEIQSDQGDGKEQQRIDVIFQNGKMLYYQGKYEDAIREWQKVAPYLEPDSPIIRQLDSVKKNYAILVKAREPLAQGKIQAERIQIPGELSDLLAKADEHFKSEAQETKIQLSKAQGTSREKEDIVEQGYLKGKKLYNEGKIDEALDMWSSIAPYVEQEAQIRQSIQNIRTSYQETSAAKKAMEDLSNVQGVKYQAPEDLMQILAQASSDSETEANKAKSQRSQMEDTFSQKEGWIKSTFANGQDLYQRGKYDEALEQWSLIAPYLENETEVKAAIGNIRKNLQEAQRLKKTLADLHEAETVKYQPPDDLVKILSEAGKRFEDEAKEAKKNQDERQAQIDRTAQDLRDRMESIFEKGKQFFYQSQYEEAITEWDKLVPYAGQDSGLKKQMDVLKQDYQTLADAKKSLADTALKAQTPIDPSYVSAIIQSIDSANQKMQTEVQSAELQKVETQKTLAERQAWIQDTFEKGKKLYESGKSYEAVQEWDKIAVYADDQSDAKIRIQQLKETFQKALAAKKEAIDAVAKQDTRLKAPEGLADYLNQVNQKLQAEAQDAAVQKQKADQNFTERQTWVAATFQKGKALYEDGKISDALAQWESITPYLTDESQIREYIQIISKSYAQTTEAKKVAEDAVNKGNYRFQTPDELGKLLTQVNQKLQADAQDAMAQKQKADKMFADRQAWVASSFQKGKALYEDGKISDALAQWNSLTPYLAEESQIKEFIQIVSKSYDQYLNAKKVAEDAAAKDNVRFQAPLELGKILTEANQKLQADAQAAADQKQKADQTFSERQTWVAATFQKGKSLYEEGKIAEALAQWNAMTPYLADEVQIREYIQMVAKSQQQAEASQKLAQDALSKKDMRSQTPEELGKLLSQANQKLQADAQDAQNKRAEMEKALTDRQQWVNSTFENGKALYEKGQYEEAIGQWEKLVPYLDEKSGIKQAVDALKQNYYFVLQAKEEAAKVQANQVKGMTLPKDISQIMSEANAALDQQIKASQAEKQKAEQAVADRDAWVKSTFEKGKQYYSIDKIDDAITEWSKLLPYMEDKETMSKILDALKQNNINAALAKKAVIDFTAGEYSQTKFPYAGEMLKLLNEANQKLQDQTQQSQAQRAQMEKALSDRKMWIQTTFEKGKALNAEGKIDQALVQWASLAPYLEDEPQIKQTIQEVQQSYAAAVKASDLAQQALSKKDMRFSTPDELDKLLTDANQKLQADAQTSASQKADAEKVLADRQAWVKAVFEKGKALQADGKITDALTQWDSIAPYLTEESQIKEYIQIIAKSQQQATEANKLAQEAVGKKDMKFPAPEELGKLLTDANQKLQADIQNSADQKANAEKSLADRQAWIKDTFEKGKALLGDGKVAEALAQWDSITPYLVDEAQIREFMQIVAKSRAQALEADKLAQEALGKKDMKFPAPEELGKLLTDANQKLQADAQASAKQKADLEKSLADRQAWIKDTFEKGKALHAQGKYVEAADEWSKIVQYVDSKDSLAKMIDTVKQSDTSANLAKKAVVDFTANQYTQLKFDRGDEIVTLLSQAIKTLQNDTQKAEGQKSEMEKALNFRKSWIQATFDKGKSLYSEGKYPEAVEQWNSIVPYLDNESKVRTLIQDVQFNYTRSADAQKAFHDIESHRDMKFKSPDELEALLTQADQKLLADAQTAESQKADIDKALSDRRVWIQTTFTKGKVLYESGKYEDAFNEWESLAPYLENEAKLRDALKSLRQNEAKMAESQKLAQDALAKKDMKFPAPDDLETLLSQADQRLQSDTQTSNAQKIEDDKTLTDRQRAMQEIFEKGQALYQQGKISEALTQWNELLPYMNDADKLKEDLAKAQKSYADSIQLKKEAEEAEFKKTMKFEAPAELQNILTQATQKLDTEAQAAQAEHAEVEKSILDRQAWINSTFEKGRNLFYAGKYKEALDLWGALLPFLVNGPDLKEMISNLNASAEKVDLAKKSTDAVKGRYDVKFPAPVDLPRMLGLVNQQLQDEAYDAESQRLKAEATFKERQAFIESTFQNGKAFFDEHKYKEAVDEWSKLTPYLDDKAPVKQLIDAFYQSYTKSVEAKTAAVEAVAQDYKGLKMPYSEQIAKLLGDANNQLQIELDAQSAKRETMEKAIAERREWSATTFNKGKIFYEQGQYDQAIEQWDRLSPYLDEQSVIRGLIDKFKKNYAAILDTKKSMDSMAQVKDTGLEPARLNEMVKYLEDANQKFKADIGQKKVELEEIQKAVNEKQSSATDTFNRGKKLYDDGQYDAAFAEWDRLKPLFSTFPSLEKAIDEAKENYQKELDVKKAIAEGSSKAQTLVSLESRLTAPTPSGLPSSAPAASEVPAPKPAAQAPAVIPPMTTQTVSTAVAAMTPPPPAPATFSEVSANSEFVSGEIAEIDNTNKTLTVKLYSAGKNKVVTVNFDAATEMIVNGEKGKGEASLQSGAAIDLRYDPETKRALYIYIY